MDSSAPAPARRTNLDRIAAILLAFDPKNTPLTSRALVDRAGASQATGFGLLRALARAGLLERVDHGLFRLGARAAGFAFAPLAWPADRQSAGSAPVDPVADRGIPERDWSDRLVRTVDCSRAMGAAPNTYDKAVRRFLALMDAPLDAPYTTPRSMAVAQGLPPGSGAGGLGILESHALLRRDNDGAYLRGERAYRIGLSALGTGTHGGAAAPILSRLRRATDQTAFLGVLGADEIAIGPHAIGRGASAVRPGQATYRCMPRETGPSRSPVLRLDVSDGGFGVVAVALDGAPERSSRPVVGLMVATGLGAPIDREWEALLEEARSRFLDARTDRSAD